jgi:tRNA pseudouridine38-40 synthase
VKRYKLTFEFDGTDFSGWQIQPDVRTVEGVVEEAFSTLYQIPVDIIGQGRTDAGVHAFAQTAHVDLPESYSEDRILHAMKGLLPEDVALKKIEHAAPDFHARFDAISREYQYTITLEPSPLDRHKCWYVYSELNEDVLHKTASMIMGEHNFINFCIPPDEEEMTTICNISKSKWSVNGTKLEYQIEGNRFLRHMVRRLVGMMIEIASGKKKPADLTNLLEGNPVKKKAPAAPSKGLALLLVKY